MMLKFPHPPNEEQLKIIIETYGQPCIAKERIFLFVNNELHFEKLQHLADLIKSPIDFEFTNLNSAIIVKENGNYYRYKLTNNGWEKTETRID